MSNPRVYELAKELGVPSKDLLSRLTSMGVEAKSHSSTVSPDVADKLRSALRGGTRQRSGAGSGAAARGAPADGAGQSDARAGQSGRPGQTRA
ncbi:MAG TPA: translation initiation factor IF-2 N-terminal domain-containing protein, partial [Actinomycetes bacterium]|nr:translation initiation factor IF-2 N-terminal domain-containing protein [Actinomycetes bacterium]